MPDPPPLAKQTRPLPVPRSAGGPVRQSYAELHCKTNYSFLEGASHPDELVQRAGDLGYAALAITDRNSLAGVVRAHVAAKAIGLPLLIGAEITPVDAPPVVLLAMDRAGYGRLSTLITLGRRHAPKGQCHITRQQIAEHAEGLLACVLPRSCSSAELAAYHEAFGDRAYLLAELHLGPDDQRQLAVWQQLSRSSRLPLVAANDVHYHISERQPLHDVLTATRYHCSVAELGERRFPNAERHLKPPAEMAHLFASCPEAIERTYEIAARCQFSLNELRYEYPLELSPPGVTPLEYLHQLTWQGARDRYPQGVPAKVCALIEHELGLISELRYEAYFLTVWDIVRFARSRGILCQGRGSAANSAVCYCLGVTSVDPDRIDVLFERFISKERGEAPDIDVDFEHERREEVLQYLYAKYGRDRAGMTAALITYRPRSAVRDVGKALGFSLDRVDKLAKNLDHITSEEQFAARFREAGVDSATRTGRQCLLLTKELLGFPRHLSQHVGGMVMTQGLLHELVPIENAAMPGRTVIEWDKDDLDALGLLKVDCLCLGMLSAIRRAFDLLHDWQQRCGQSEQRKIHHGGTEARSKEEGARDKESSQPSAISHQPLWSINHQPSTINHQTSSPLTLATIPSEDPVVYDMICRADTVGVFQIESRAQMSMLPRLKPRCFYDLVIEVAIVRPGPIQGDMVHPYLRRRRGEEPVTFPDDRIRSVLNKTLGVPLFQEQAMKLAVVAAGFTPGEADQLRRAMAAWRRKGGLEPFRQKLVDGMTTNGYEAEFAERVYKQICGFGEYGFPESHAASFALLVYVSAWLKCYHPAAFTAALLNSQPMGFYAPAQLIADAKKHGVTVLPPDVNASDWDCTLEVSGQRSAVSHQPEGEGIHHGGTEARSNEEGARDKGQVPRGEESRQPSAIGHQRSAPPVDQSSTINDQPSPALRLGLRMISGLPLAATQQIARVRQHGPFRSVDDFQLRTGLGRGVCQRLARADAFASLGIARRQALWQALPDHDTGPLFQSLTNEERPADLPALTPAMEVTADYRTTGLSLRAHPFQFLRPQVAALRAVTAQSLEATPDGQRVKVAGLVLLRQRPGTAKGVTFVTLEDETGQVNLVIWQSVWDRFRRVARSASAMLVTGHVQKADGVIHVVTQRIEDLSEHLGGIAPPSRDFR